MLSSEGFGSARRVAMLIATAGLSAVAFGQQQSGKSTKARTATVTVTAAVVLKDLTVRPIPLLALTVINASDSSRSVDVRTSLDGRASMTLDWGSYRIRSTKPATVADSTYAWDVPFEVGRTGAAIELTNANARVAPVAVAPPAPAAPIAAPTEHQVAPERVIYERLRRGVFRVEAGLATGSGFLIDGESGLVVTNAHVVHGNLTAALMLDSTTRVPAQVVSRDEDADLAILRFAVGRCNDCPTLELSRPGTGDALVIAGERVLAIGFPLHQEEILTTGIVASVRDGVIISDVNINHGNSGGPMLNEAGHVVGVNTFIDAAQNGPGISGSVAISRIDPLLAKARDAMASLPPLPDRLLPVMPEAAYPLPLLRSVADTANGDALKHLGSRSAGKFTVSIMTPVINRILRTKNDADLAKERRERESNAGVSDDEKFSQASALHDWERYVGRDLAPVISVTISPKLAETFWSALNRSMEARYGYQSAATMKFKGDVRGARFYRNGVEVEPFMGGHGPMAVQVNNQWVSVKDVADEGYYVLSPELFAPDSIGRPARVAIVIQDLKNPESLSKLEIEGESSAWVWNSFVPYLETLGSGPVPRANRELLSPDLSLNCDSKTGECSPKP